MKRLDFIKKLSLGAVAVAIGGPIIKDLIKEPIYDPKKVTFFEYGGMRYWINWDLFQKQREFTIEREKEIFKLTL
jgi:hypothetical protein